jgi:hypothetical protein
MRTTRILFMLCGLFAAVPAWADMSGTYLGNGPGTTVMIQIVETSGGNFTGRYELKATTVEAEHSTTRSVRRLAST